MPDYRINIIIMKGMANTFMPAYLVYKSSRDIRIIVPYTLLAVLAFVFLFYIYFKKLRYSATFLRKVYVPSIKLFIMLQLIESILIVFLYYYLSKYLIGGIHGAFSLILFIYAYWKISRQRIRINSFDNNFKLGIISRNIGEVNGLRKGEVVKIIQTNIDGYIVKNSKGTDFTIEKEDISEIIDIS